MPNGSYQGVLTNRSAAAVEVPQLAAVPPTDERDSVADPERLDERHESGELRVAVRVGGALCAADHEQSDEHVVPVAQPCDGGDDRVDALPRHQSAKLEDHVLARVDAQPGADFGPVDRPEQLWIVAARDDADPPGVRPVEVDEVVCVLRALGDHQVRFARDALLDREALVREPVGAALVAAPHAAERVERDDVWHPGPGLDVGRHKAGHPEIGVHQVVRLGAGAARARIDSRKAGMSGSRSSLGTSAGGPAGTW